MKYSELVQAYFDRSTALQWYWTIYIIVIGGVLAFSSFRQHKDVLVTILVTALYGCFAYKNLGAIEATIVERQAILGEIKAYPTSTADPANLASLRQRLEPALVSQEPQDIHNFHLVCDLMTIAAIWVKEFRRKKAEPST
jgi:hypothetical protein